MVKRDMVDSISGCINHLIILSLVTLLRKGGATGWLYAIGQLILLLRGILLRITDWKVSNLVIASIITSMGIPLKTTAISAFES